MAESMVDSTDALSNERQASPPREYSVSVQIAFFSFKVKGTKGRTVETLDNTDACAGNEILSQTNLNCVNHVPRVFPIPWDGEGPLPQGTLRVTSIPQDSDAIPGIGR
jgi:hypothetical protein